MFNIKCFFDLMEDLIFCYELYIVNVNVELIFGLICNWDL